MHAAGRRDVIILSSGFSGLGEAMGKGDVRSRRGKIFNGSYGKKRPRKKKKAQQKR